MERSFYHSFGYRFLRLFFVYAITIQALNQLGWQTWPRPAQIIALLLPYLVTQKKHAAPRRPRHHHTLAHQI